MTAVALAFLKENLELGELLLAGRDSMFQPQDLPGHCSVLDLAQAARNSISACVNFKA
jgi:hypothetical protein